MTRTGQIASLHKKKARYPHALKTFIHALKTFIKFKKSKIPSL